MALSGKNKFRRVKKILLKKKDAKIPINLPFSRSPGSGNFNQFYSQLEKTKKKLTEKFQKKKIFASIEIEDINKSQEILRKEQKRRPSMSVVLDKFLRENSEFQALRQSLNRNQKRINLLNEEDIHLENCFESEEFQTSTNSMIDESSQETKKIQKIIQKGEKTQEGGDKTGKLKERRKSKIKPTYKRRRFIFRKKSDIEFEIQKKVQKKKKLKQGKKRKKLSRGFKRIDGDPFSKQKSYVLKNRLTNQSEYHSFWKTCINALLKSKNLQKNSTIGHREIYGVGANLNKEEKEEFEERVGESWMPCLEFERYLSVDLIEQRDQFREDKFNRIKKRVHSLS